MEVYLDNSATTRCLESVRDIMVRTMMEDYGNPSSKHNKGMESERYLIESQEIIAKVMKVNRHEIYFTSGGTESNNWAIVGAAMANRRTGMHLITTAIEHPAVLQPMRYLEELGFRVTYIPVDRYGVLDLEALEKAVSEDTILVSTMYVNNEIGTVEPIEQISGIIKKKNPQILYHVDAIQAFGKYRIFPRKLGIDMLSVSAHKIHGPKGIGFLYANEKVKIKPLILGGGQQKGMRSGTENVPGAAGMGAAVREAYQDFEEKSAYLYHLKQYFIEGIEQIPEVVVNSLPGQDGAPHIVSVSFAGVRSEVLLHALEEKGIYVSSGSACTSHKKLPVSTVLKEIGVKRELLNSTVRFSFSTLTTKEELEYCLNQLRDVLPVLRKYSRH